MQYEDTIEVRGVTVMRQTEGALLCRMGNQHRWTPTAERRWAAGGERNVDGD